MVMSEQSPTYLLDNWCELPVSDKNKKQEILRDALRERIRGRDAEAAVCLVLHESNDDSLIRQFGRIFISTPLNSNLARTISSLMRRNESMARIVLHWCGITDNLLQIIGENMKSSHLRVKKVELWEEDWDVSFETLKSFFSSLEVDRLVMWASPTDRREEFPIFQNVRTLIIIPMFAVTITNERHRVLFERNDFSGEFNKNEKFLKLDIKDGHLHDVVRAQNTFVADRVQVTAEGECWAGLKDLHVMLDPKCEVDGQGMDLTVEVKLDDLELNTLVTGCSDIREACARWSVRSLDVMLEVESKEFLRKFKHEIGDYKIPHLTLLGSDSYVFCDDDFNITSSIAAQCQVEHLKLISIKNLKSENLKSILRNCKLKILECPWWTTFPTGEFNEIQEAARLSGTELRQINPSVSDHPILPKFDFPRHFSTSSTNIQLLHHLPTSSPDVHFPHHLAFSSPVVPLPYHVPSSSTGVRLPCDSPTSSTNFRLPYHLPTSSTVVRHPYYSPASLTDFRLPYNSPTPSPVVPIPYHLPTSSTGVPLPYGSPASSTNVDLVSEDDYEQDYSTEANDDDSNANDEIPSKKRRAI